MLQTSHDAVSRRFVRPPASTKRADQDEVSIGAVELISVLRAYAISLTRNWAQADDLVQETLMKMITNRGQFVSGSNLKAWAFTILRHAHINTVRRAVSRPMDELDEDACETEAGQDWHMQNIDLQAALDGLSPEHRNVVIMVGALGLTYDEAAEACGVAVGTIKSRLFRGRALLAKRLGYENAEWRSSSV